MSPSIGVLIGAISRRVYAVINPDDEAELDNPRWLLIQNDEKEPVVLLRIARDDYMAATSIEEVAALVERMG